MKGSIRFNNDIIAEVDVDPSAASGSRLTSCKNLIDGQELGGGGGSSDFSTAEVTIRATELSDYDPPTRIVSKTPVIYNNEYAPIDIAYSNEITVLIPLYKGSAVFNDSEFFRNLAWDNNSNNYDISGNIEYVETDDYYHLIITGDCSIGIGEEK